jgi:hypothetical protein
MNKNKLLLLCILFPFHILIHAGVREAVFIGLTRGGAPAIELTFDKLLRDQLAVQPTILISDYLQTQHYSSLIRFHEFPVVSRTLVESIEKFASDTTLFIWGTITKSSITPQRKNLIMASIKGEVDITLTIYCLAKKEYAYTGKIHAEATRPKGIILTQSVSSTIHADAIDQSALMDECSAQAVRKAIDIINGVVRNLTSTDAAVAPENTESYMVPSISDVFSIPSIEARKIGSEADSTDTTATKGKK